MSQKEARNEKLHRSFELIEDEFIVEASPQNAKPMVAIRRHIIKKVALIAACACLCVAAIPLFFLFGKDEPVEEPPQIPVYDDAQYSALDIGNLFSGKYESVATNAYQKIYVPSDEYLNITPIPNEEYLPIYKLSDIKKELDKKEFSKLVDTIFQKVFSAMSIELPNYTIEYNDDNYGNMGSYWKINLLRLENLFVSARQSSLQNFFSFNGRNHGISLNGVNIEIDQSKSDDEIKASLTPIKEKLFEVFGVEFNDVKIIRNYSSYSPHGATQVYVYFYNSNEPLENVFGKPILDYIELSFDNFKNFEDDIVSDTVLSDVSIRYVERRDKADQLYTVPKKLKMISLEDAEALLRRGYVFGGHSCRLCMAMQDPIDFENYDHVGFEYIQGSTNSNEVLPFYAFYKYIGDTQNGNKTYAKTYVPAIKVSGYEEYFESQTKYHKQSTGTEYVEFE